MGFGRVFLVPRSHALVVWARRRASGLSRRRSRDPKMTKTTHGPQDGPGNHGTAHPPQSAGLGFGDLSDLSGQPDDHRPRSWRSPPAQCPRPAPSLPNCRNPASGSPAAPVCGSKTHSHCPDEHEILPPTVPRFGTAFARCFAPGMSACMSDLPGMQKALPTEIGKGLGSRRSVRD